MLAGTHNNSKRNDKNRDTTATTTTEVYVRGKVVASLGPLWQLQQSVAERRCFLSPLFVVFCNGFLNFSFIILIDFLCIFDVWGAPGRVVHRRVNLVSDAEADMRI